jgi:hypothetical protein
MHGKAGGSRFQLATTFHPGTPEAPFNLANSNLSADLDATEARVRGGLGNRPGCINMAGRVCGFCQNWQPVTGGGAGGGGRKARTYPALPHRSRYSPVEPRAGRGDYPRTALAPFLAEGEPRPSQNRGRQYFP